MSSRSTIILAAIAVAIVAVAAALLTTGSPHAPRRTGSAPTGPSPAAATTTQPPRAAPARDPEHAAAAFTVAFLTYRWDDPAGQLRRRCRPWDTDAVDAALAGPGLPFDRDRRAAGHETDDVTIHAVNPQDRAVDHLDASVVAQVTIERPRQPPRPTIEFLDVRVVATASGWVVAQVSQ
jgi:hypothetical protein